MITINELNNLKQKTMSNGYYVQIEPRHLKELLDSYECDEDDDDTYENYKKLAN